MTQIIFVGGTGRCGKSVVAECLAQHPDAFKLPFELRFLTDPDGIVDFYASSQASWSPFLADRRIKRLGRLLQTLGASPGHKYTGWQLSERIPAWYQHIGLLMQNLYDFRYKCNWVGAEGNGSMYHAGPTDKSDLACVLGAFVETVIKDLLETNNKSIFISDDTWSVLFAKELSELLPGAKFIHVYRDPRDVVSSMSKQRWCPSELEQAARYYVDLMRQISKVCSDLAEPFYESTPSIPGTGSIHNICFEDFVSFAQLRLIELQSHTGLMFDPAMLKPLDSTKANTGRWRDEPERGWVELVMPLVKRLGYK